MSLYHILTDRFTIPVIEKHRAEGFAEGFTKELVEISAGRWEQDFANGMTDFLSTVFAGKFAGNLDKARRNGDEGNAAHRARGFAEGFASGFTVARRESERAGIAPCQAEFLAQCLAKTQAKSEAANVADAFGKGLVEGEKRAAKQPSANSRP